MTTTVKQLQETAQTVLPESPVTVRGTSGEDYPVKAIFADGDVLLITVDDESPEPDEDNRDDEDEDEDE